ncbi:histidine kinase [Pseudonocardia bannensis]|uniref:Histidine kinase n=2 Tax=Pseudonocardia bannensis TaxID=630973 RepID=A0A848DH13_9PSEU|nr:histidine kinase [Pseudonocardia bannensis]
MDRPLEPLWRGLLVYRVLTLISVSVLALFRLDEYAAPAGALTVMAVMAVWTAVTAYGYLGGPPDRRGRLAVADLVVTTGVMATTPFVLTPAQLDAGIPGMGSIWTPGAALASAIAFGLRGGVAGALVISAALLLSKGRIGTAELGDVQLLVLAGLTIGFASTVLRRWAERVRLAVAAEAAAAERERLARSIHDGVLQVLSHVRRRGAELGGGAAELGVLAGEQEVALRTLLTGGSAAVDGAGRRDLAAALRALTSSQVTVSAPAHPLELPAATVDELVAVVRAALANTAAHVGPDAPAWVFVEEGDDTVEISVRDDGPGIPDGRLAEAEQQGRLGVARSMRGRVHDLGGTIDCDTGPGRGTEWIIRVPTAGVRT